MLKNVPCRTAFTLSKVLHTYLAAWSSLGLISTKSFSSCSELYFTVLDLKEEEHLLRKLATDGVPEAAVCLPKDLQPI